MKTLRVSRSTAQFIKNGHPWVRVDRYTVGLEQLRCGEAVTLLDDRGNGIASALADPESPICARVYHRQANKPLDIPLALQRAYERRKKLWKDEHTNTFRLVHGEADFLPGLRIDVYNDCLIILCRSRAMLTYKQDILRACRALLPTYAIVFKKQIQDLRSENIAIDVPTDMHHDSMLWATEHGSHAAVYPCQDLACGIYIDQRATRTFLHQHCRGTDIANAFAYTGFFSSSLLHAGAASAIDIDIAQPALDIACLNAEKNNVSERHRIHCGDSTTYFNNHDTMFDIIILDPPTAAQGKNKKGWLLRRDYPLLIQAAWARLRSGGILVACCNTLGQKKQFKLRQHLEQHLSESEVNMLPPLELGIDIPQTKGFPEGRPYELCLCTKT